MDNNLQLLNNTEYRLKFKTGSDINNVIKRPYFAELDEAVAVPSIEINDSDPLASSSPWTISFWFQILGPAAGSQDYGGYFDSGGAHSFRMYKGVSGHYITFKNNGNILSANNVANPIFSFDDWVHLVITNTPTGSGNMGTRKMYINGQFIQQADHDADFVYDGRILGRTPQGTPAHSYLNEVSIFKSKDLTEAEILNIYNEGGGANLNSLGPDHWLRFNNNYSNSGTSNASTTISGISFIEDTNTNIVAKSKDPLLGEMFLETSRQSDVSFNGRNKRDTDYTFGGGELSLSAWINTTKNKFIIATDSPSGGNDTSFAIGFNSNTTPYVLIGNPGQEVYKTGSSSPINDGNWHNVIVTIDNSNVMNFYIDGILQTTHTFSILPGASSNPTHFGNGWLSAISTGAWGLDGQVNGLGIWERSLTSTEINAISSSDRYSTTAYHFSPDLWVGSTDPALYTCTDTTGTMSKVTDLTAKIGDVPMLKANANVFTRTSSVSSSGAGFSYSFWFYDDGTETGSQTIFKNDTTHNSHVVVNHDSSTIQFLKHAHSSNIIINNSSIASAITHGYELTYEKNKLNNFLFTKQGADPYFTKLYLNGELVASSDQNVVYYPGDLFNEINPKMTNGEEMEFSLLLGDVAYWDADISDIFDEVYSPNQGHKGYQGDWRNLSIPPKHYWRLGFPLEDGQVKDIGIDGTNHLTSRQPIEETYSAQVYSDNNPTDWLFYPQDGVMHGLSNGQPNPYDPEMFMLVGDTINITRPDSSHPLHIKDSSGNDVAVSNIPYSLNSLSFDGLDDFLDVGNITSINSIANASYSFWYKTSATGKVGLIGGGIGTSAYHWTDGNMYVHSWGDTSASHSITIPTLGNWHHIVCTFESSASKLYVDGSLQSTVDHGNTTASNAGNNFAVGKVSHYNIPDGQKLMDEVAIFTSTLSASDVTAIYNSGVPNDISSLNPTHWWRMGDNNSGSGTTITDQGSGGNDGTLTNGPTFSTDAPTLPPSIYSLDFDGSDDYLDLGSGFTTTNQFTISAWINPDNLSTGYGYLLGNNLGTGISLDEGGGAAGAGKFYLWTGSGTVDVLSTTALTINNWFHVVFVCDKTVGTKGEIKFYINGSLDKTTTLSNQDLNNIPLLSYVGSSSSHFFNGQLDEVAIFNSALSSSDITSIYNSGVPGNISSLNPVGWWRMGDNDGGMGTTVTDQGSGGNDGTLINGPTFSTNVPSLPAWNGNSYALSLDGSDDFVNLGGSSDFDSVSSFSISAWIKADSFSGYPMILAKTNGTTAKSFQFYIDQVSSKPTLAVNFSGFNSSTDPISTGVWTHVAVTWTSGTGAVAFYINGSANGTATGSTSITTNTDDCCIGAKPSGGGFSNYFDGLIDEVAFFDSALSSSDITSIYNSGVPGDISSLNPVGWWRMGDNDSKSGTTITDQGSGGNDGTLVNGPTFSTDVLVAPFPTDVPGATYTTTFSPTIAGTYQYYCTSHSSMIGNINVLQREGYENIFGIDRSTES